MKIYLVVKGRLIQMPKFSSDQACGIKAYAAQ